MSKGEDIVPIPGTKRVSYLEENVAASEMELSADEIERLEQTISEHAVAGGRYADRDMTLLNN
jgi:aryl-alcohol dehydrogenase-like predicted oxidoreductase